MHMTTTTTKRKGRRQKQDLERLEEMTIAMAQSEIQGAMDASGLRQSELAEKLGKPRSFISRILRGDHDLTVRTMARIFGACGFEVRFKRVPPATVTRTVPPRGP
jgi:transcriptional regulator with XRE-family HTH domain